MRRVNMSPHSDYFVTTIKPNEFLELFYVTWCMWMVVWDSAGNSIAWDLTWGNLFILTWESKELFEGKQSSSVERLMNWILITFWCVVLGLLHVFKIYFVVITQFTINYVRQLIRECFKEKKGLKAGKS